MTSPWRRMRSANPSPRPVTHIASKTSRGGGPASASASVSSRPAVERISATVRPKTAATDGSGATPNGSRTTPTRSRRPGGSASGAGNADCGSRGSGPRVSSKTARASATERASGPAWDSVSLTVPGQTGIAPSVGLNPTTPQNDAGMRIEPPASVPVATGTAPDATVAPEPALEPPEFLAGFHGLRVTPVRGELPVPFQPNSGVVVFPITIAPAEVSRATIGADSRAGSSELVSEPFPVGSPW